MHVSFQDWNVCSKMSNPLGQSGLQKRLMRFDLRKCNAELVARAKQILERIQLEDIVKKSRGGACFFVYVSDDVTLSLSRKTTWR